MPRARGQKEYIALTGGLITEASPLAAPEGTSFDEVNMNLDLKDTKRVRRKGLQRALPSTLSRTGKVLSSYNWDAADLLVLATFSSLPDETYDTVTLHFIKTEDNTELANYQFQAFDGNVTAPSMSELRNRLVVTFGVHPFVFAQESDGSLSAWYIDLFIRDFKLLDDGLSISDRPATLSDEHKYNIFNSGWYQEVGISASADTLAYLAFETETGVYPSNADKVQVGVVTASDGTTEFNAKAYKTPTFGNSRAARGHYVYNIRNIDRDSKLTFPESDGTPPKTLTKILDAGTNLTGFGSNVLYVEETPRGTPIDPPRSGGGGAGDGLYPIVDYRDPE